MKQKIELEIEVPDGKKAVWKDGQIIFEDIELPKTWEEYCKRPDRKIGTPPITFYLWSDVKDKDVTYGVEQYLLLSQQEARKHFALMKLHLLRDYYCQDWNPSYLYDEQKYYISNATGFIEIACTNRRVPFLSFPTRELAEQFVKNCKELIIQAGDLI